MKSFELTTPNVVFLLVVDSPTTQLLHNLSVLVTKIKVN